MLILKLFIKLLLKGDSSCIKTVKLKGRIYIVSVSEYKSDISNLENLKSALESNTHN